jgi:hypothetical protein
MATQLLTRKLNKYVLIYHNISHNKMIYLLIVVTDDLLLRQKSLVIYQSGSIYRSVTNPSVAAQLFTNPAVVTDHLPIRG